MSNFWQAILSSENTTSSKRVVTLITAACFFAAQFLIIFIAFYVIFYTTKGKVDKDLLEMLKEVLSYDFYIILSGLGCILFANSINCLLLECPLNPSTVFTCILTLYT